MSKVEESKGDEFLSRRNQIVLRSNRATEIVWGPCPDTAGVESKEIVAPAEGGVEVRVSLPRTEIPVVVTKDGKYIALVPFGTSVTHVYSTDSGDKLAELPVPAQALSFSPLGSYLVTWHRKKGGDPNPNLLVWNWREQSRVGEFHEKGYDKDTWPTLQWTSDESAAARLSGAQLQVFRDGEFSRVAQYLDTPKAAFFTMSPGPAPFHMAVFTPPVKAAPAFVAVYQVGHFAKAKVRRSFFRSSKVFMWWAPDGGAVIVEGRSGFSAESYQGDSSLYYLGTDGTSSAVPMETGPVQCIDWSPNSDEFVLVAGRSRPSAQVFDRKCTLIYDFGKQARNMASYSANGRFLVLVGFSGMNGTMDFHHRFKKSLMGSTSTHIDAVAVEWSPCGRFLLTPTVTPRLRVDNGFAVYKYNSCGPIRTVIEKGSAWELYQAFWLPSPNTYADRPPSPRGRKEAQAAKKARGSAKKEVKVYRSRHSTGLVAQMMKADGSTKGKGVIKANAGSGAASVASDTSAAKKKLTKGERKRRAAERKAAAEAEAKAKAEAEAAEAARQKQALLDAAKNNPDALTPQQRAKRLKQVNKKLRQLDAVKAKRDAGETLNEDQLKKLETEAGLVAERDSLMSV